MNRIKLIHAFLALVFLMSITAFGQNNNKKGVQNGIAVLELFTSEGCSSCPPADEFMGKIQKEYQESKVYVLSYHVDYWDRQGWKDIFSNPDYTKRQYAYADWLGKEPIYTPQLIINGKSDFIGSQENAVRSGIKKALSTAASADVTLEAMQSGSKLTIKHIVKGSSKNSQLLLAIVQKTAKSSIKRGENANRTLSHFQIVQHLHTILLKEDGNGSVTLTVPKGFNSKDFEVIGFVQDAKSGAILGANKAIL